jgi:hypothetical protein
VTSRASLPRETGFRAAWNLIVFPTAKNRHLVVVGRSVEAVDQDARDGAQGDVDDVVGAATA